MNKIYIGVDTGVNTGFAVVGLDGGLNLCETLKIHQAMEKVREIVNDNCPFVGVEVFVEDARKRKWIPSSRGREVLQGAGSVKRDAVVWEDFLIDLAKKHEGLKFHMVAPKNNRTKLDVRHFSIITGYSGRTSEHARDAAMLVSKFIVGKCNG